MLKRIHSLITEQTVWAVTGFFSYLYYAGMMSVYIRNWWIGVEWIPPTSIEDAIFGGILYLVGGLFFLFIATPYIRYRFIHGVPSTAKQLKHAWKFIRSSRGIIKIISVFLIFDIPLSILYGDQFALRLMAIVFALMVLQTMIYLEFAYLDRYRALNESGPGTRNYRIYKGILALLLYLALAPVCWGFIWSEIEMNSPSEREASVRTKEPIAGIVPSEGANLYVLKPVRFHEDGGVFRYKDATIYVSKDQIASIRIERKSMIGKRDSLYVSLWNGIEGRVLVYLQ
jgi:hypothetical protein